MLTKSLLNIVEEYKTTLGEREDEVVIGKEKVTYAELSIIDGKDVIKEYVEPTIDFSKWGGEEHLSIIYPDTQFSDKTLVDGELQMSAGKEGFYFRQHDTDTLKFGLILNEIPDKSKVVSIDGGEYYQWSFKLVGWANFNFLYQPPLKNIDEDGSTWEWLDEKNQRGLCKRPFWLSGGYEVFHKTKRNHIEGQTNYGIGKFCDIYVPVFIDSDGKKERATIEIKDGVYIVSIPQTFLDKAKYPVKANDTVGNTSIGGSSVNYVANYLYGSLFTTVNGGTLTKIQAAIWGFVGTGYGKVAIYNETGDTHPESLVANSSSGAMATTSETAGWIESIGVSGILNASMNYWLVLVDNHNWVNISYTSGGTLYYNVVSSYASFPYDPAPAPANGGLNISVYATYTPSGGEAAPVNWIKF